MNVNPSISSWLKRIEHELKISDWSELCKTDADGILIAPAYGSSHQNEVSEPAFYNSNWDIVYRLPKSYPTTEANVRYLNALHSGATALWYDVNSNAPKNLFASIEAPYILNILEGSLDSLHLSLDYFLDKGYNTSKVWLLLKHDLYTIPNYEGLRRLFLSKHNYFKAMSWLMVSTEAYHAQGATAAFEIALGLSLLLELHIQFKESPAPVVFHTAVTEQFYNQISKLRAVHRIWNLWKQTHMHLPHLLLSTSNSTRFYSALDADTNLLRSAVSVLASKIGGASAIQNTTAHLHLQQQDFNYEYLAIAQQLLMREEMLLHHYADISCGAYFVEYYTDALAEKALYWISEIQKQGGIHKAIQKGWIKTQIDMQQQQQDAAFWNNEQFKIGINAFLQHSETSSMPVKTDTIFPGYNYEIKAHANTSL
jgi:hypothetical protein